MFVGYAIKHEGDCYEMLDPTTSIVFELCNVIWLKRMYYQKKVECNVDDLQPWPLTADPDDDNVTEV
eukprot:5569217-Ditylum_brightwellii.AAC.1